MFQSRLQIENLTTRHAGAYTCLVTSSVGNDEITYDVEVMTPPQIINEGRDISSEVVVKMNRPLTLSCWITASPPPQVTWYKVNRYKRLTEKNRCFFSCLVIRIS